MEICVKWFGGNIRFGHDVLEALVASDAWLIKPSRTQQKRNVEEWREFYKVCGETDIITNNLQYYTFELSIYIAGTKS